MQQCARLKWHMEGIECVHFGGFNSERSVLKKEKKMWVCMEAVARGDIPVTLPFI